jgi:hypothetical protein
MRGIHQLLPRELALGCTLVLAAAACDGKSHTPALSRSADVVRTAPIPPENGPQLGVISEQLQVREYTDTAAPSLGVLRAGARVARSAEPVSHAGCTAGWYAVRPRGFVCVGAEATLDLNHPTLAAMALAPNLEGQLPYTYARTRVETSLFERSPGPVDAVREVGKLRRRAGMAVVGSWNAKDPGGADTRLALLTDGRFVRASDLEAAKPSDFVGMELGKRADLPLAFVVKRGVRSFRLSGSEAEKGDLLEYHSELALSGRFRSLGSVKYWAFDGGALRPSDAGQEKWVRHQDVTVVQRRATFPDFVADETRWLDVSVTTGTLVAYEGKRAVFATLLSVARELPEGSAETQPASDGPRPIPLGITQVKQKALTFGGREPHGLGFGEAFEVADVPWALELASGQLIHAAYWHDRFGIDHGAGSFALSPSDASRLFRFVGPELPRGWHAVVATTGQGTPVVIRK